MHICTSEEAVTTGIVYLKEKKKKSKVTRLVLTASIPHLLRSSEVCVRVEDLLL